MAYTPATPLEAAIHAGDAEATLALLRAATPQDRAARRTSVARLVKLLNEARWANGPSEWGHPPTDGQKRSADIAVVLCGTADDVAASWVDDDLLVALCTEFRPRSLDGLADAELARSPLRIRTVQRLIVAGLAARPDTDAYTLGLIALPQALRKAEDLALLLAADPGLRPALLRVFDIEGTSDVSLASIDKYNHQPATNWSVMLRSLVDDGLASRETLLDRTLAALERDWPQYRAGWFSRFHGDLAPTTTELHANLPRYLALCASRIAPTVTLALDALRKITAAHPIAGPTLLETLRPVMASSVKAQLDAAMRLLDRVVEWEPQLAVQASAVAATGLLHETAPVQAAVLGRIARWGLDDELRGRLGEFAGSVAATNRPQLLDLVGSAGHSTDEVLPAADSSTDEPVDPISDDRRLAPIADLRDLVDCIAHVFEHSDDVDAFERAVTALVVAAPIADAAHMFAPVLKRAARMKQLLPRELARLLRFVVDGDATAGEVGVDSAGNASTLEGQLVARTNDLMAMSMQGRHLEPLSAPTHRGGFIAAELMVARVRAHYSARCTSSVAEQVRALLRLAPGAAPALVAQARLLTDDAFTRALRYALGDDVAPGDEAHLFAAAARIRHPRADDRNLEARHPGLGPDAALVARCEWQVSSRSNEYDGRTYTFHDLSVTTRDAPASNGDVPLAVRRHPPADATRSWYRGWSFAGNDPGAIRYSATLLPSDLEAFFADGARAIGNNLDWSEAAWQNSAYLEVLLDRATPMTTMALLLLVLGLAGKDPGQAAIAVDALVHARSGGRLAAAGGLAKTLRALLATPLLKAARLHKSLQAALRADPRTSELIFELLCAAMQARPDDPPRDTALLLDLLLELKVAGARSVPPEAQAALAAMTLTGNGRALQRKLLAA